MHQFMLHVVNNLNKICDIKTKNIPAKFVESKWVNGELLETIKERCIRHKKAIFTNI